MASQLHVLQQQQQHPQVFVDKAFEGPEELCGGKESVESIRDIEAASTRKVDVFVVDWESPDDPLKPLNWGSSKWVNVGIVSLITFLSSLASSMFAPGVPQLMQEFDSNDTLLASFVLSVYVLGFAAGPTLLAPLSEFFGRAKLYNVSNFLFLLFNLGCGLSQNLPMLIVFRFMAGCAGAAPLAIGGGTIVDLVAVELRGKVMTIFASGPMVGPIVGPVLGGVVVEAWGWRASFWVISVLSGITTIASLAFLRETSAKILLEQKAQRLRTETNDDRFSSCMASDLSYKKAFAAAIVMPLRMLVTQPIIIYLSLYMALVYGYLYLFFTTFTNVFQVQYNFSTSVVGLAYVGLGVGFTAGIFFTYFTSDRLLKSLTEKHGGVSKPEYRLPPMVYSSPILPIGVLIYGWTAEFKVHFVLPMIGQALVGFGLLLVLMPLQTYLIDGFTKYAASALAAATIVRCLVAAVLPLAGQPMYAALGLGWGNSLLAGIALAMTPLPWYCMKYGESMRQNHAASLGK